MYQKFRDKLKNSEFFKHSLTLFSGSLIAQLIPLAIMPLLTRLFNEDIFGIYFVYSSILIILSVLATLRFELACVLPDKDADALNLLMVSLGSTFLVSILTGLGILFFYDFIIQFLGAKRIGNWLYLIPLSVFLLGNFQSFSYWHNRKKTYLDISYSKVSKAIAAGSAQITTGYSPLQQIGLIPGMVLGQIVSSLYLGYSAFKSFKHLLREISFIRMRQLILVYKDIPLFNTLMDVLNKISNQLPIFLLTRFFGLSATAYYGLATRVINTPIGLIGQSVGQVFFQKASTLKNQKSGLYPFVKKMYLQLFRIALPLFVLLTLISFFFGFIFGDKWETAGNFTLILLPWLFVMFMNSPITFLITVLNRQRQMIVYNILLLAARFVALYAGYTIYNSVYYALILFALAGLIFNGFLMFYLLHIAQKADQ